MLVIYSYRHERALGVSHEAVKADFGVSGSCRGHHSLVWVSDLPCSAKGLLMPQDKVHGTQFAH